MPATRRYRTTLNCGNCLAAARPALDALGAESWSVDLEVPERILTVSGDVAPEAVAAALDEAGFEAELLDERA